MDILKTILIIEYFIFMPACLIAADTHENVFKIFLGLHAIAMMAAVIVGTPMFLLYM